MSHSERLTTSGHINVEVVPIEKQPNGSDCGVCASAFAFEWALGSTSMDREYNGPSMRQHLCECLESGKVVAFPSSKKRTWTETTESKYDTLLMTALSNIEWF